MVHQNVLTFWFDELTPRQWWRVDPDLDAQIACRFGALWDQARQGELHDWRQVAYGRLAEVIVLDQFSRNVHRNTPHAFSQDAIALVLAQEAVAAGALEVLSPVECSFLLMPYMHSESLRIHQAAQPLFAAYTPPETQDYERRHKAIVERFGRYPHRNAILDRPSTDAERAFLEQPGSRF
ncbi:DUF924 domain-containing protein [Candidatus Macondimonas diazotrophica]|jgi:uncharacterized protein (DUF924 family)|nr:DUF924 domain-containing protein [Candidatus Macondimonas diazotrophica]HBG51963.1 DUF924 domain-containing protein [Gammaproteobacteria bacterium]